MIYSSQKKYKKSVFRFLHITRGDAIVLTSDKSLTPIW